uniref:Rps3p n=1 Tax=Brettanomyces custersianus TaxID=13368 RepID=C7FEW6_BRECS|nr:Rps3p [Brettanomyces custersianus]ACU32823.1 Rps3p [Brettanomyces custersianus]
MNKERIMRIIRGVIIREFEREEIGIEGIKREIRGIIRLIEIRIKEAINKEISKRIIWVKRINNLERVNHINDFKLISYKYNKNELTKKTIISKLIIRLLENILTGIRYRTEDEYKLKRIENPIIISRPVIKESLSRVQILFYYNLPNYKSYNWYNRLVKYMNIDNNNDIKYLKNNIKINSKINNLKLLNNKLNINIYDDVLFMRNNNKLNNNINKWIIRNNLTLLNSSNLLKRLNTLIKFNELKSIKSNNIKNNIANIYTNKVLINLINNNSILTNNNLIYNNLSSILSNLNVLINNKINKVNNKLIINSLKEIINNIYLDNNKINKLSIINNDILLEKKDINKGIRGYHTMEEKDEMRINLLERIRRINEEGKERNLNKIYEEQLDVLDKRGLISKEILNKDEINKEKGGKELKYIIWSVDKLLGNLNSEKGMNKEFISNKLNIILSKYFNNKEIEIKPIQLKYEFNNSEILIKLNRRGVSKRTRTISRIFRFRLNKRIRLLNEKIILENEIKNRNNINLRLENDILHISNNIKNMLIESSVNNKLNNNLNWSYNDIKDYYSNKKDLNNNLKYKNLIGWSLLIKGKIGLRKGKNRSNRLLISKGSFKNILLNRGLSKDRLRLNYISNNQIKSYLDKHTDNGKLGINMTLNII